MINANTSDKISHVQSDFASLDVDGPRAPDVAIGTARHGAGECTPCAWFWKEQGCLWKELHHGQECGFCHLCPREEIKARRRAKVASTRSDAAPLQSQSLPATPEGRMPKSPPLPPPPSPACGLLDTLLIDRLVIPPPPGLERCLPSIGSIQHGTGRCKPCGWFWKEAGCSNGSECCHCHLCPRGEFHARRQAKLALLRHQKVLAANCVDDDELATAKVEEKDKAGCMADAQQPPLPSLVGRLRPAPLTLHKESHVPIKGMPGQSAAPILRLSDRV